MKDSIQIFVESYARVGAKDLETSEFFNAFYKQFLNSSPEVADKFQNTDMASQLQMLRISLDHMIYFAIDKEETDSITHVAKIHSQAQTDIPEHLYELWLDSLLLTVSKFDSQYTPNVEAAWREALSPAIEFMKGHYHNS